MGVGSPVELQPSLFDTSQRGRLGPVAVIEARKVPSLSFSIRSSFVKRASASINILQGKSDSELSSIERTHILPTKIPLHLPRYLRRCSSMEPILRQPPRRLERITRRNPILIIPHMIRQNRNNMLRPLLQLLPKLEVPCKVRGKGITLPRSNEFVIEPDGVPERETTPDVGAETDFSTG